MTREEIEAVEKFIETPITEATVQPEQPEFTSANVCGAKNFTFRFAGPEDSERFSAWIAGNPQIDRGDVTASVGNPTCTYLVVECDGVPVMLMPVYLVMRIGYLAFNPSAGRAVREGAMEQMLSALKSFAALYQISTIDVLTRSGIPVAEWARAHGFQSDARELFKLELFQPSPEGRQT